MDKQAPETTAAHADNPIDALNKLHQALIRGLPLAKARQDVALINGSISAELEAGRDDFARRLFHPQTLSLVRQVLVMTDFRSLPLLGAENQIALVEARPPPELERIFVALNLNGVPREEQAAVRYMERLIDEAEDLSVPREKRAEGLVTVAAMALAAGDLQGALSFVAKAISLAPTKSVLASAAFVSVTLMAMARAGKFLTASDCPRWSDVVAVLRATLMFESRFPIGTPGQITRTNSGGNLDG